MKKDKKDNKKVPLLEYKFIDSTDSKNNVDRAFDILFEEVLKSQKK